jgi:hypothetical protein
MSAELLSQKSSNGNTWSGIPVDSKCPKHATFEPTINRNMRGAVMRVLGVPGLCMICDESAQGMGGCAS